MVCIFLTRIVLVMPLCSHTEILAHPGVIINPLIRDLKKDLYQRTLGLSCSDLHGNCAGLPTFGVTCVERREVQTKGE